MSAGTDPRIDVRASDGERDQTVAVLRGHHADGRLTLEEFTERVEEAYRARSRTELDHALRELPRQPGEQRPAGRSPRPRRFRRGGRTQAWWLRINGICTAIWAMTTVGTGPHYFWPMWVMLGTGIPVVAAAGHGRRHEVAEAPTPPAVPAQEPPQLDSDTDTAGRVLSTVLFVDIVSSTERAAAMGDAAWNAMLAGYERHVHEELAACGGFEVFTKGDELVAAFATPAAAVRCASAVRRAAHRLGFDVRAGVHAGEVDQRGREMRGLAMHIGQRVCATAQPGQVLVSSTVRDLLVGSTLHFTDAGMHELKGVPGQWQLFAVDTEPSEVA